MIKNLPLAQTMLALAYSADISSGMEGSTRVISEKTRNSIICTLSNLSPIAGQWELVWGPVVYKFPLARMPDNTMFIARHREHPERLVIAIAGTDSKSISDWLLEDFTVARQVDWPYGGKGRPEGAKISEGAHIGLTILQSMSPLSGFAGQGATLEDFILEQAVTNVLPLELFVTGHSLGGALTAVLALWLLETQASWKAKAGTIVKAYPFAGPTAGNAAFVQLFNESFEGDHLLVVNNDLDIVPLAWEADGLARLPDIYAPKYRPDLILRLLEDGVVKLVKRLGYHYVGASDQRHILPGTLHDEGKTSGSADERYLAQVAYQHVNAYPQLLSLPNLLDQLAACKEK